MPVTITTKTKKPAAKDKAKEVSAVVQQAERAAAIDKCGALEREYKAKAAILNEAAAKYKAAAAEFNTKYVVPGTADLSKEEKAIWHGAEYDCEIGKPPKARLIKDQAAAFHALEGVKTGLAIELMSFKLGDLDKYLTADQLTELLETTRGARGFSFIPHPEE